MTLTNPKPLGWSNGEVFSSTQASAIGNQLPYAVDGNAGGTYAPTDPIILGGDGLTVTGPLVISGTCARIENLAAAAYSVTATSTTGICTLASLYAPTGYSLASNEITLPGNGWYEATLTCQMTCALTANPQRIGLSLVHSTSVLLAENLRFSATAADTVLISGVSTFQITDYTTQKLSLLMSAANTQSVDGTVSRLLLRRHTLV